MKYLEEYKKWYSHMKGEEGGVANQKNDKGGLTNKGVIRSTFFGLAKLLKISPVTKEKFLTMTDEEHSRFALYFWNLTYPNLFNSGRLVAFVTEEFWGGGPGVIDFYQRKLNLAFYSNLKVDGAIGKQTISAINAIDENLMWNALCIWKRERYTKIPERDATQNDFIKGWRIRLEKFEKLFAQQAGEAPKKEIQAPKAVFDEVEYKNRLQEVKADIDGVLQRELNR